MTTSAAAISGNLKDMEKALEECNKYYYQDLEYAIQSGSLELVDWMLKNGFTFRNNNELAIAAETGNLEMVKLLQKHSFKFNYRGGEIKSAAKHGHLEMIKYIRKQGCKYALDVENYDCRTGRYEVIVSTNNGHNDIVTWLINDGCDEANSLIAMEYIGMF